jgi:alkylation response protein AidB-like acyl-CoA dehydrogenase
MDFRLAEEEEIFRTEVQDFLSQELPPDWPGAVVMGHEETFDDIYQFGIHIRRKLAAKGWIGLSWPKEYGGQGASIMKQMILEEELVYRATPGYDLHSMWLAGPLILQFGTEQQKRRFIPPLTRGEERWSIGMSEPNAGSDLVALQLRAVEEKDCFVLNGQKSWTSGAHHADWCMVYARTDPDAPKHRGISIFLVNLKSPGITMRRITDMSGLATLNEVFYDNVKVPKENMLGEKNKGWGVALASFASERTLGILLINNARRELGLLMQYCRETYIDGQPLAKDPVVRNRLAEMAIEIEVGRNLGHKLNWMVTKGMPIVVEGSQCRVYGSLVTVRLANLGMQMLGLQGQLDEKSEWAKLSGRMKNGYLNAAAVGIWSGTTEVAKNTIATLGLGLPRG